MPRPASLALLAALLVSVSSGSPAAPAVQPPKADATKGKIDRTGATKKRLLKEFGGSEESEEAVMLGLAWLTQMQKPGGHWEFDGGHHPDHAAATGLSVLAFLGAGQSHQAGRYKQTVQAGLDWLVKSVNTSEGPDRGRFRTAGTMYGQGIATLALCEACGMTEDPSVRVAAQAAVDYIQRAQGPNGSWGYHPRTAGDTSIVGWQIQALHAARLAKLNVDDRVVNKAVDFLNYVSTGKNKAAYGYTTPARDLNGPPRTNTSLTAIGLLCRYYADGWKTGHAGFDEGTKGLMTRAPSVGEVKPPLDLYYYYYATQVVRYFGGDDWKRWNEGAAQANGTRHGGMADWLIGLQDRTPNHRGSWAPQNGDQWIAGNCGRLGTTCLCLLTLEVYYRYDPTAGEKPPK